MRVVITAAAKADLLAIRRTIEPHNLTRAVSFVEERLDRCQALANTPRAYSLVLRYERLGILRCVHSDYLIFYRLQPDQIEVIHGPAGRTGRRRAAVRLPMNQDQQKETPCRKRTDTGL